MKKLFVAGLFLLGIAVSVSGQTPIRSWQDTVAGTWVWQKTVCCNMGGGSLKKAVPGKREKVICMKKDSTLIVYEEGELKYTAKYKVTGSIFMNDPVMYMFVSDPMFGILRFKQDTLVIGNCATDGCDEFFVPDRPAKAKAIKRKKVKNVHNK